MQEMQQVSVAVSIEQMDTVRAAVEVGEYASESDVLQQALLDWQANREVEAIGVDRLRQLWMRA